MLNFYSFLAESLDVDKLQHLEHAEDHIIHGGDEGVGHAASTLEDAHNLLSGKKSKSKITVKYDGSPSVVFGKHPETGKFFVASKSAFNKNPKINYTEEDIDKNHGHAPGLAAKLKAALKHLPKTMPNEGGVYQGDFLYEKPDVTKDGDKYKFTPNTITYGAHKNSGMGKRIANSQIGFVVHTKYKGKKFEDMKAGFDVDHSKFKQHPDVNLVNPEINSGHSFNYTKPAQSKFALHKKNALESYQKIHPETMEKLGNHAEHMKQYINQTVRDGTTPNPKEYVKFLKQKRDNEASPELVSYV